MEVETGCAVKLQLVSVSLLVAALLVPIGCATRWFVREHVHRVDLRVRKLEADLNQEKDRVSRVAADVTEAHALSEEALQAAKRALARGDEALARAGQTDRRLSRLWTNRNRRSPVATAVITFGFDKWELDERARIELLGTAKQLKESPDLLVVLEGHTDTVGPAPYNVTLSQRRVEAVRRFLWQQGVDLDRIQALGLGEAHPVADNTTEEGRAQNRRVVIKLFIVAQ